MNAGNNNKNNNNNNNGKKRTRKGFVGYVQPEGHGEEEKFEEFSWNSQSATGFIDTSNIQVLEEEIYESVQNYIKRRIKARIIPGKGWNEETVILQLLLTLPHVGNDLEQQQEQEEEEATHKRTISIEFPVAAREIGNTGFISFGDYANPSYVYDKIVDIAWQEYKDKLDKLRFSGVYLDEQFPFSNFTVSKVFIYNEDLPAEFDQLGNKTDYTNTMMEKKAYNVFDSYSMQSLKYSDFAEINGAPIELILDSEGLCLLATLEYLFQASVTSSEHDNEGIDRIFRSVSEYERLQEFMSKIRHQFTAHERQAFYNGKIVESIYAYARLYPDVFIDKVGLYNIHTGRCYYVTQKRETETMTAENETEIELKEIFGGSTELHANEFKWWVVYEAMHVVPIRQDQLMRMVKKSTTIVRPQQEEEEHKLAEELDIGGKSITIIKGKINLEYIQSRWERHQSESQVRHKSQNEETAAAVTFDYFKMYNFNFELRASPSLLQKKIEKISERIKETGICAFDFETYIDDENDGEMFGNARPYLLAVYGRIYRDKTILDIYTESAQNMQELDADEEHEMRTNENDDKKTKSRIELILVDKIFEGTDCAQEFVNWIVSEGILINEIPTRDLMKSGTKERCHTKHLKEYSNIFIAHNGARFDFRFIIDRLSRFANLDIMGTIEKIKKMRFKNLFFFDSYQLLPQKLSVLCKSLGVKNKKFPCDDIIANITKQTWNTQENLPRMKKYCRRDAIALHEVYEKYITERATTYFNNTAFPKELFPPTASQAALDILKNCFIQHKLCANHSVLEKEKAAYSGGACLVFKTSSLYGLVLDMNSSYPAAMCNNMPFEFVKQESFEREPKVNNFEDISLYRVTFEFPEGCLYPSLMVRAGDDNKELLFPLKTHFPHQSSWEFGVSINFAIKMERCKVSAYEEITYNGEKLFDTFSRELYHMRLEEKSDDTMQLMLKLSLNGAYGKFGERKEDESVYGHYQEIEDMIEEGTINSTFDCTNREFNLYGKIGGGGKNILHEKETSRKMGKIKSIKRLVSENDQLFEMKYESLMDQQNDKHIGYLCRFAAYITSLARVNLFNAIVKIQETFNSYFGFKETEEMFITYIDTDSLHIDLSEGFQHEQMDEFEELLKQGKDMTQIQEYLTEMIKECKNMFLLIQEELCTEQRKFVFYRKLEIFKTTFAEIVHVVRATKVDSQESFEILVRQITNIIKLQQDNNISLGLSLAQMNIPDEEFLEYAKKILKEILLPYYEKFIGERVQQLYNENPLFYLLKEMKLEDSCNVCFDNKEIASPLPPPQQNLLDDKRLGGFKIEKYVVSAFYVGAKEYAYKAFEPDKNMLLATECKMKGIQYHERVFDHYEEIYNTLNFENFRLMDCEEYVREYEEEEFGVMHTAIKIRNIVKCITPTLTKRYFTDKKGLYSRPFADEEEWIQWYEFCQRINSYMKENFMNKSKIARDYITQQQEQQEQQESSSSSLSMEALLLSEKLEETKEQSDNLYERNNVICVDGALEKLAEFIDSNIKCGIDVRECGLTDMGRQAIFTKMFMFDKLHDFMEQQSMTSAQYISIFMEGLHNLMNEDKYSNLAKSATTSIFQNCIRAHIIEYTFVTLEIMRISPYADICRYFMNTSNHRNEQEARLLAIVKNDFDMFCFVLSKGNEEMIEELHDFDDLLQRREYTENIASTRTKGKLNSNKLRIIKYRNKIEAKFERSSNVSGGSRNKRLKNELDMMTVKKILGGDEITSRWRTFAAVIAKIWPSQRVYRQQF